MPSILIPISGIAIILAAFISHLLAEGHKNSRVKISDTRIKMKNTREHLIDLNKKIDQINQQHLLN